MQITVPNDILLAEVGALLAEGKDVEILTKGVSMLPFIVGDRDSVLLRKDNGSRPLAPGDIVLARIAGTNYVLHRVMQIGRNVVVLRGDGNIRVCETVSPENVLGRVIRIIHPSGKSFRPGGAVIWRHSSELFRRFVLSIYKRTIYKILMNNEKG
ncbi:MAG: S24/S26 family peptidase [Bacteroidales bacterium]|nr:S24/S26 family peptidase [Bacteroidales bacterium]